MPPRAAACLVFTALLAGCATPQVEPVYPIQVAQRLVVVPATEATSRRHELGRLTTSALAGRAAFEVVPYDRVLDLERSVGPRALTSREVAARTGADFVLEIEVEWQEEQDGFVHSKRARARARLTEYVHLTPAEEEQQAAGQARLEEEYPGVHWCFRPSPADRFVREDAVTAWVPDVDTPERVEERLVQAIARKVAFLYITHDVEQIEVE